jgi:hypothetical protein
MRSESSEGRLSILICESSVQLLLVRICIRGERKYYYAICFFEKLVESRELEYKGFNRL